MKTGGILDGMTPVEVDEQAVQQALKRVLDNPVFVRQERLSRFLRFVVERHLVGREGELKESVIGVEIFGRRPDYNPKADAIVRTEARRLRALLNEYYLGDGKGDAVIIELPKGGYVPVFRAGATRSRPARRRRVWRWLTILPVIAAAAWWVVHRHNSPIPIAVLPLINLSQNQGDDYFTDGLTDEIIRSLSILDGLAVRSQTSSFTFKGKPRNVREAGKLLDAEYILEGSILRAGRQLRINAQLVRTRDDYPVWSGRYDRELTDIFAIQDEISRGIVNGLRLKLGRGRRRYETSTEAYDLYLRARSFEMLPALSGINKSIPPFEQAIAKDPSFAPAYAGLAAAHSARSGFDRFNPAERAEEISKGWAAAEKAIQLDPLLAEAHDAQGLMHARAARWHKAESSFVRAIELAPGDPLWREHFTGSFLLPVGRTDEAVRQMRIAVKADPLSPATHFGLRQALRADGRFAEADVDCRKMAQTDPQKSGCRVDVLLRQGKGAEAARILEARLTSHAEEARSATLAIAYALAGRREDAEKIALLARPQGRASIFAALGDKDRTFEALEQMVPLGPVRLGRDLTAPGFAFIRGDPRFKVLRKKVGLPE